MTLSLFVFVLICSNSRYPTLVTLPDISIRFPRHFPVFPFIPFHLNFFFLSFHSIFFSSRFLTSSFSPISLYLSLPYLLSFLIHFPLAQSIPVPLSLSFLFLPFFILFLSICVPSIFKYFSISDKSTLGKTVKSQRTQRLIYRVEIRCSPWKTQKRVKRKWNTLSSCVTENSQAKTR